MIKIKHRLISTIAAFVCVMSVFAANAAPAYAYETLYTNDSDIVARYEETAWQFRMNNGVLEKRLWSITYGRWLTDWMPVNP